MSNAERPERRARRWAAIGLIALIALSLLLASAGRGNHAAAAGNNELENVELALELTRTLVQGEWGDALERWSGQGQQRYLPVVADLFFGAGWLIAGPEFLSIRRLNLAALALLLLALYALARRSLSRPYALLACLLLAGVPLVNVSARFVNPYLLAAAAVTAALWGLERSNGLTDPKRAALAGALTGLALLTERGLPPIMLSGPLAYVLGRTLLRPAAPGGRRRMLLGLALFVAVALLLAGPNLANYLADSQRVLNQAYFGTPGGDTAHAPDPLYYLSVAWRELLTPAVALLFALLLPLSLLRSPRPWLLWLWLLVPLAALSSFKTKLPYYAFGLLPPLALLATHGLANIPWGRARRALVGLSVALVAANLGLALYSMPRPPWYWPPPGVPEWIAANSGGAWHQIDYPSRFDGTGERIAALAKREQAAAVLISADDNDVRVRAWTAVVGRLLPNLPVVLLVSDRSDSKPEVAAEAWLLCGPPSTPPLPALHALPPGQGMLHDDEMSRLVRLELERWTARDRTALRHSAGRELIVIAVFPPAESDNRALPDTTNRQQQ